MGMKGSHSIICISEFGHSYDRVLGILDFAFFGVSIGLIFKGFLFKENSPSLVLYYILTCFDNFVLSIFY